MFQAGARPMTSLRYPLELRRGWARGRLQYDYRNRRTLGGAYGLGITYAKQMFGASEGAH